MSFQKGVAQTVQIICYDSETPTDPTSPVVTVAKDTGSFTAATNSPTVVTPGRVVIALTATEMNADAIAVKVSSDNLEDQIALFYTEADYTATRAGYLNAGIDTRAPASSALDKATWTDARASWIDKLNVSGTLAHTDNANSFKATGFATAGDAMTLTSGERTNLAAAIWNWLTSAITTAGSIGKLILDNLNATISSRAPAATALSNVDWTSTRAGRIDKLNVSGTLANTDNANQFKADVSGVAPAGEYDAAMAKLDVAVSTRSTFDPATDTVKAKDHLGNPFAAEADIRDAIIEADLSDYEDTAATGTTLGEFMVASRAGIVGRMKIEGTTITFYQTDGTTPIFTATLNDADVPTERGTPTDPA